MSEAMTVLDPENKPAGNPVVTALKVALEQENLVEVVEAAKRLRFTYALEYGRYGKAADRLIVIESEADRFPTGPERERWNKEALQKLDLELEKYFGNVLDELKTLLPDIEKLAR